MKRLFALIVMTVAPAAEAQQPGPICLAAAERMMEFMVAEIEADPNLDFGPTFKSANGREILTRQAAISFGSERDCGLMLAMPDSTMRAMAKGFKPQR